MYSEGYNITIFIVSPLRCIPKEREHLITIVPATKPDQKEIEETLRGYARNLHYAIDNEAEDIGELALELKGLSNLQIKQILDLAYCNGGYISKEKDSYCIIE